MKKTNIKRNQISDEKLIDDYIKANGKITFCEPGAESENILYTAGTRRKKDYTKEEKK